MQLHTTRMLNSMGDITIGWTPDQSDMMVDLIDKKMKEGYTFFILEQDNREVRLKNIDDLRKLNSVIIGDKEAELLIKQGRIGLVEFMNSTDRIDEESSSTEIKTVRRAKTAQEAATSNTVQVAPKKGG